MDTKQNYKFYPCLKSGRLLKGFCVSSGDIRALVDTLSSWRLFARQFGIKFFALSVDGSVFEIKPL